MARTINRLNARAVATISEPGRHADGGGLYLSISPNGGRRWTFLYRWHGKPTEIGFGSARAVKLVQARELAAAARSKLAAGLNPKEARRKTTTATFGECADDLIEAMRPSWRNEKHQAQWQMTLKVYAAPLRSLPVDSVTTDDVLNVLKPIWASKPETASRLRGRIERVLDAARAKGLRTGENPARWRGHLAVLLPARRRLTRGHHAAMSYADVPIFMGRLRATGTAASAALEFTILTAARTSEVIGATWDEFELRPVPVLCRDQFGREQTIRGPFWCIPATRMKAGREHRVPLSPGAVAILERVHLRRAFGPVFPGQHPAHSLSIMALEMVLRRMGVTNATVHGFRSSFRDWAAEQTDVANEVVEMALAHVVKNKVEAAYRRGDLFEKRRELMDAWDRYCSPMSVAARNASAGLPVELANV